MAVELLDCTQLPVIASNKGEIMARHRLTVEEQRKGVERALESPRTPPQLKKGLRKREEQLGMGRRDSSGVRGAGESSRSSTEDQGSTHRTNSSAPRGSSSGKSSSRG